MNSAEWYNHPDNPAFDDEIDNLDSTCPLCEHEDSFETPRLDTNRCCKNCWYKF